MDKAEISRWALAADLLERVLDLPWEQQEETAQRFGRERGVSKELDALLTGARADSILDHTLKDALEQFLVAAPEHNQFKGQVFGNWSLGDEFGRGGMSVIYHASRVSTDFDQHAALKILSVAHLGDDFVDSFLRERQILSDLQHPGIARLIDGGITPQGAPFLVMQRVDGERIDHWCERQQASLGTICDLVIQLCHAVAYAQGRLVVHQDINPSNVLIDEHGQPVLIDFGIARLLGHAARVRELRAFTPEYAAPEQREGGAITTATDVYGLGLMLSKLLGRHALDRDLRAILEMATSADPEQRYANARLLAGDLQAWKDKRPVTARPSTSGYRAARFVARNRWAVAAAGLATISLVSGLGIAVWQARIASAERDLAQAQSARSEQVTGFLKDLFRASDPDRAQGESVSARELLDQGAYQLNLAFEAAPELRAEMMILLGDLYRELGELDAAVPLLQRGLDLADSLDDDLLRVDALRAQALLKMESGAYEEAHALAQDAEDLLRRRGEIPGPRHAAMMHPLLYSLAETGQVTEAVERGRVALATARDAPALPDDVLYAYLFSVAHVMLMAESTEDAEPLLEEAATIGKDLTNNPTTSIALYNNIAGLLDRKGNLDPALEYRRQAVELAEKIYPPEHAERARMLSNLGSLLIKLGRHAEAEQALRQALTIYDRLHGTEAHPRVAAAHNNLGRALHVAGEYDAAEPQLTLARDMALQLFGPDDHRFIVATGNLGDLQRRLGRFERANELLTESLERRRSVFGTDHRAVGDGLSLLASLRLDQHRPAEALLLTEEALALFQRIGYQNPASVVGTTTRQAQALAALGRVNEADAAFTHALQLGEAAGVDAGTAWLILLEAHAAFLAERGDPAATAAAERALAACSQALGEDHPETIRLRQLLRGNEFRD